MKYRGVIYLAEFVEVFPNASRSQTIASKFITNDEGAVALHLVARVNAGSDLILVVKGNDPVSDTSYTLLTSAALASGSTVLKVGPDYTAGANVAKDYLPYEWFIEATPSGATEFSVGASMI